MALGKHAGIRLCREIAKEYDAQAIVVISVNRDGIVVTSTYGEDAVKCNAIGQWAHGWMEHALSVIPFRIVFGWGNNGVPLPLTEGELKALTPSGKKYHERMHANA